MPDPALPDHAGGWAIAILPFLEEQILWEHLTNGPTTQSVIEVSQRRPRIMTCPVAFEGDSSITGVPPSHYSMSVFVDRKGNRSGGGFKMCH